MISRRNIRVKVMQILYALQTFSGSDEGQSQKTNPVKLLQSQLDKTKELFVFLVYHLTEIARYAEQDAFQRASKNLPSEEDKNVNTKIAGNIYVWKMLENPGYKAAVDAFSPQLRSDKQIIKKLYNQLTQTDEYKKYIVGERTAAADKEIALFIFNRLMIENEDFVSYVEDVYTNLADDDEMIRQLVVGYITKPQSYDLEEMVGKEKWQYARDLMTTVLEKKEYLQQMIAPKLKNWDAERIALLDMVLMEMGVSELLYFETIPPKVTINEYIDVAKEYSTPQSGQFINGILDSIHKDLVATNKIRKVDYKSK